MVFFIKKKMIKAGVLGAGHLGKIHLRLLNESDRYELIGFYDPDKKNAQIVSKEKGYKYFDTPEALVKAVDMVDIVTPTLSHHEMAMLSLKHGKQIFIEKTHC